MKDAIIQFSQSSLIRKAKEQIYKIASAKQGIAGRQIILVLMLFLTLASTACRSAEKEEEVEAPDAPLDLVATPGATRIVLDWEEVDKAESYNVYFATDLKDIEDGTIIKDVDRPYKFTDAVAGKNYQFAVTALIKDSESKLSDEAEASLVGAPEDVKVAPHDKQTVVTWKQNSAAKSYTLYWSNSSGAKNSGNKITNVESPFVHTNLANGTKHFYVITGTYVDGESPASIEVNTTPQAAVTVPDKPTNISATPGPGSITIRWTEITGLTYNLYWSNNSGGAITGAKISSVKSPHTHVANVGMNYFFVVKAENTHGESEASDESSATPQAMVAKPTAPQNIRVTPWDSRNVVSWNTVTEATNYNLYVSTSSGGARTKYSNITGTTYNHTGLTNGATYFYVVKAENLAGESQDSSEMSGTPFKEVVLPPPTNVAARGESGGVVVSWTQVTGASSYAVYYSTTSGDVWGKTNTSTTNNFKKITGIICNNTTVYYFVVTTYNSAGQSPDPGSTEVSATCSP